MLELDRINSLIEILQLAKSVGYSIHSSPVQPLIEVTIDLLLKLSNLFQQRGIFWEARKNPSIKFLDISDSLGNPKSIKLFERSRLAENPQLSEYFRKKAVELSRIKSLKDLPQDLYPYGQDRKKPPKISSKEHHFFRRTRNRKKKTHH